MAGQQRKNAFLFDRERQSLNSGVLQHWLGGSSREISMLVRGFLEMNDFAMAFKMQSNMQVVYNKKVAGFGKVFKEALVETSGVNMFKFWTANVTSDNPDQKFVVVQLQPVAIVSRPDSKCATLMKCCGKGLMMHAKIIIGWEISNFVFGHIFAPQGLALIAAKNLSLAYNMVQISSA